MKSLLLSLSLLGGASCAAIVSPSPGAPPLAWRLVEAPVPGGKALVMEAWDPSGSLKISIRFERDSAAVGELVEAEIRLPEASGRHRLEVLPDRPGVEIVGPREVWVDGPRPALVRFTRRAPGPGGISVELRD